MPYFTALFLLAVSQIASALPIEHHQAVTHSDVVRILVGLASIVAVIIVLSLIIKRLNLINLSSSKGFQQVASMVLGPKEKIMLLQVGQRYLLMGVGSGTITMLYDFGEQLPQGFGVEEKASFAELLKSAVRKT